MLYFPLWKKALILGLCALGVIFAAPNLMSPELRQSLPSWVPSNTVNLGLDLQGGAHLLVEVKVEDVFKERMVALGGEVRSVLKKAGINRRGRPVPGPDNLTVRITDPADIARAGVALNGLVNSVGGLMGGGGADVTVALGDDQTYTMALTEAAKAQITDSTMSQALEIIRRRVDATGTREPTIQREGERRILIQVPGVESAEQIIDLIGRTAKLTFNLVDSSITQSDIAAGRIPAGRIVLPSVDQKGESYAVERRALVTGNQLVDAQPGFDQRTSLPVVNFRFDAAGGKRFGEATRANVGRLFAIVLDGEVISAPRIQTAILGGSGQISGNFTVKSARNLAILLRAGALPADITVLEQRTVGPNLGADSVAAGKIAGIVAFAAVMVYMIATYGLFGVFADMALICNVALIFAALSVLGATLTLPGIAGIVLTIGMAVDANVLIFERIREEIKQARGAARAIESGYARAFSAIIDANITTLIATTILFTMGSGPVKGFAVTLTIGIVTSVFTAILVTRLIIAGWFARAKPKTITV